MRYILSIILLIAACFSFAQGSNTRVRTLIVIFDGLRPDYITAEYMPNVYSLKSRSAYASANHSVFPTVTRVNASSYATGSYPSTHGLLGNSVFFPEVDKTKALSTGDANNLMRIDRATDGKLLTTASLGEILKLSGFRLMVFSSGSSGQAFLQNHTVSGGGVINPEVILPEQLKQDVYETIGAPPVSAEPNMKQHDWAARAFLQYGLAADGPLVSAIWFSDPDGTAHSHGIGSPAAIESIKAVDEQFGFIIKTMESRNLLQYFNIIITADHGFATQKGTTGIEDYLISQGLKRSNTSDDIILAGNALYVKDNDRAAIKRIVSSLQEQPWVGAIFTKASRDGGLKGWVDGTLSFDAIHWDHQRSADILVDYNWDDQPNEHDYKGTSYATGVAGHGGASPYEIHIPLIAHGPAFKSRVESAVPTSNTDIVPTILHYYDIAIPATMDGRVMHEILADKSSVAPAVKKETIETSAKLANGNYRLVLQRSIVGEQQYVDFTQVYRDRAQQKAQR